MKYPNDEMATNETSRKSDLVMKSLLMKYHNDDFAIDEMS